MSGVMPALCSHPDANIRSSECRGVIDTVFCHRHNFTLLPELLALVLAMRLDARFHLVEPA